MVTLLTEPLYYIVTDSYGTRTVSNTFSDFTGLWFMSRYSSTLAVYADAVYKAEMDDEGNGNWVKLSEGL